MYSNVRTSAGSVMPLLMGCTKPSKIQVAETNDAIIYDPVSQTVKMDLRIVGTKSLKNSTTKVPSSAVGCGYLKRPDQKNEIDDQKSV